jgi:hypothetical protein
MILGPRLDLSAANAAPAYPTPVHAFDVVTPFSSQENLKAATLAHLFELAELLPVTRAMAMGIGAVARVRHLATGTIGRFPLQAVNARGVLSDQPTILQQPEIGRPYFTTMSWAVDACFFYGRAWFEIVERYAEDQRPRKLQWVPEWDAELGEDGNLIGLKSSGRRISAMDVIRVDGPHEGLLNFAAGRVREAAAIDVAAANASANPVPSVVLRQVAGEPLTDDKITELTSTWAALRRTKNGGVGFVNQSVEVDTLGQPLEQLLIDGRNYTALNLVRSAGFPAWSADVEVNGSSLTYSNAPSRSRELIDYALAPYMAAFEARFSMDDILPAGTWCRFDTSQLLRGDLKSRLEDYKLAIEIGLYDLAQVKALEAGSPAEGHA